MTNKTLYQTAFASRIAFVEEAKTKVLWTQDLDRVDCRAVSEYKDELVEIKILDSYDPPENPSGGPI